MTRASTDPVTLPCACTALRKVTRAVSRHYEACLAPAGLTTTQYSILRLLQREGPMPLRHIADRLVLERTSLYRAVRPLERDGLVTLQVDPNDARVKRARLTRKAAARIKKALPHWRRAQRTFVAAVGAEDWAVASSQLDRFLARMAEDPSVRGHVRSEHHATSEVDTP